MNALEEIRQSKKSSINYGKMADENRALRIAQDAEEYAKVILIKMKSEKKFNERIMFEYNGLQINGWFKNNPNSLSGDEREIYVELVNFFRSQNEWESDYKERLEYIEERMEGIVLDSNGEPMYVSENSLMARTIVGDIATNIEDAGVAIVNRFFDKIINWVDKKVNQPLEKSVKEDFTDQGKDIPPFIKGGMSAATGFKNTPEAFKRVVETPMTMKKLKEIEKETLSNLTRFQNLDKIITY